MKQTDELLLKLMLTLARDRQAMQGRIRSVGFMREYLTLPQDLGVHTLTNMSEQEIEELSLSVSIKEKSKISKFHFYLNDIRYHLLQSIHNSMPLISLTYGQWLLYEKHAGVAEGTIAAYLSAEASHIPLVKFDANYMSSLVNYMLFQGTEDGPSMHQAEGLFIFEDALNMNSWTLMTKEQAISHALMHGYVQVKQQEKNAILSISMTT